MTKSFKEKTTISFFWVTVEKLSLKLLQFIISIVLARLLLPEEFGLIGVLGIFISLSMVLIDSGFSFTLIRKEHVSDGDYNVVFWFNLSVSIFSFVLLWIASPYIAKFYNQEILSNIVKVIALNLIINAISSIQNIKLNRESRFKQLSIVEITSKFISGAAAIGFALAGYGVWSLVFQQIIMNLSRNILMFYYNRFIPKIEFSMSIFRELFNFSSKLLYGSISFAIVNNIYQIVMGKYFQFSDVGVFNKSRSLHNLPIGIFMGIIRKVTLPAFSQIQNDDKKFKRSYKIAMKLSIYTILLPLIFMVVAAYPLIEFLYTEKWIFCAPILQILSIGGIFFPLSALNINIIGIKGRSDLVMTSQFLKDGLKITGLLVGINWGIFGLMWSYTITNFLSFFINVYYVNKVMDYPLLEQIKNILPIIVIGFISGALTYIGFQFLNLSNFYLLILEFTCMTLLYFGFSYVFKLSELDRILDMLKLLKNRNEK